MPEQQPLRQQGPTAHTTNAGIGGVARLLAIREVDDLVLRLGYVLVGILLACCRRILGQPFPLRQHNTEFRTAIQNKKLI